MCNILQPCFPIKKIYSLLFLLLLLLCLPGMCSAAEMTMDELTQLEAIFNQLESNNQMQEQQLQKASELLTKSSQQIILLQAQLAQANQSINQAQSALDKANKSLQTYANEQKAIQAKLKIERDFAILAAVFFAVRK